nr:MAG TPA: transposase-like protein [Caudoviricetes sp.]
MCLTALLFHQVIVLSILYHYEVLPYHLHI